MESKLFIGFDVHDNSIASQRAEGKEKSLYKKTGTSAEDLKCFREEIEIQLTPGQQVYGAYEAGPHGPQFKKLLESWGWNCEMVSPHSLEHSRKWRNQKCDPKDALRVLDALRSHHLAGKKLSTCWIPDDQLRDHREIQRERVDMGDEVTRIKNKINGFLRQYGIKRPKEYKTIWSKKHKQWLKEICHNGMLARYGSEKLQSNLRQLSFYEKEEQHLDLLLKKVSEHPRHRKQSEALMKERGVGLLTAMTVLLEMGEAQRFSNRKQIASYFGLVPKQYESGEQDERKGRITRTGSSRVRKVLNQSAWAMMQYGDYRIKKWYGQVAHRRGGKKAVVALMRKLLIRLWHKACEAA